MFSQLSNRESLRDLIVDLETYHSKCYHLGMGKNVSKSSLIRTNQDRDYHIFDLGYKNVKILMLYKIHKIGAYFIVRAKKNLQYKSIKWKRKLPKNGLSDANILLTGFYPKEYYPEPLRLIRYLNEEQEREFTFITNTTHIAALQVAELYKNRWLVESFFKWPKQHLKIKRFLGHYRECRSNTDICCNMHLLLSSNHSTRYTT